MGNVRGHGADAMTWPANLHVHKASKVRAASNDKYGSEELPMSVAYIKEVLLFRRIIVMVK